MNERIGQLAAEAFESIDYPFKQEINMPDILVEKFAELLIKECAAHLNFVGDDYAGIELLEHFGVE